MLQLQKIIGRGASRICYEHPQSPNLCVKIYTKKGYGEKELKEEIKIYQEVKNKLSPYICHYEEELVPTNQGLGLVTEIIRDDNLDTSQSLGLKYPHITEEYYQQLDDFCHRLIENKIYFYDFNVANFVVQEKDKHQYLKYIDLKSYKKYKPWTYLRLERIIPYLAHTALKQRIKKLYKIIKRPYRF